MDKNRPGSICHSQPLFSNLFRLRSQLSPSVLPWRNARNLFWESPGDKVEREGCEQRRQLSRTGAASLTGVPTPCLTPAVQGNPPERVRPSSVVCSVERMVKSRWSGGRRASIFDFADGQSGLPPLRGRARARGFRSQFIKLWTF